MALGTLYLISTPIGNLEDITLRALNVLGEVNIVLAEDTRTTKKLLTHFGLKKKVLSYFEKNKDSRLKDITFLLEDGKSIAFLSEAGTPGIADPGETLVKMAIERKFPIVFIPGASAVLAALVPSGLDTEQYLFLNFPPRKKGQRKELLESIKSLPYSIIFFESKRRILSLIEDAIEVMGENRPAVIARELTKIFEEFIRGTLQEVYTELKNKPEILGEVVLVIGSFKEKKADKLDNVEVAPLIKEFLKDSSLKEACKKVGKILGLRTNEVYKRFLNETKN